MPLFSTFKATSFSCSFETDCWFVFSNQAPNIVTGFCLEVCCAKKIFVSVLFSNAQITHMLWFDHTKEQRERRGQNRPFVIQAVLLTGVDGDSHP